MENVTINISGDVNIHFDLCDPDDFFEDDEFLDDFDEEEEADDSACSDFTITVNGLPDDIDEEAVQVVIETACKILDDLIDKAAASRKGEPHEGV